MPLRESTDAVRGYPSLSSAWRQDNRTLVASVDNDAEDADSDKKEPAEGKDDEDGRSKELWDSAQLG